jgi:hypothetical protein
VGEENVNQSRNYYWFIVDFDDVVAHSTTFQNDIADAVKDKLQVDVQVYKELYDQAKVVNSEGKSVLRFEILIDNLEQRYPGARAVIQEFIATVEMNAYVDQGVKRALQAIQCLDPYNSVRVSILTFGDIEFQKMRINRTDTADFVHDIIYTEGSKKEVVEQLAGSYNPQQRRPGHGNPLPIIVTIDDSKTHLEDYNTLGQKNDYLNVQYSNPQAKRYHQKGLVDQTVVFDETQPNQAAVNIYKLAGILVTDYKDTKDRVALFNELSTPGKLDERLRIVYESVPHYNERFERIGNKIFIDYDIKWTTANDDEMIHLKDEWVIIEDGSIVKPGVGFWPQDFNMEEYIRGAAPAPVRTPGGA